MAAPRRVKILVADAPAEMKAAVDRAASESDSSRNEIVASAIAARYGLKYVSTGSPYTPGADLSAGPWSIEVPENVRRKLRVEAARRGGTISGLIRETLALRFDLSPEPVTRRPRT
jgi:hypothetical protein